VDLTQDKQVASSIGSMNVVRTRKHRVDLQDLEKEGIMARVVSMPCWELFDEQSQEYRDSVLPPDVTARVSVEAGASLCWHK
jgi:transketolase